MTKAEAALAAADEYVPAADAPDSDAIILIKPATVVAAPVDPLQTGITKLRAVSTSAQRIWSTKAPKETGGTISAVLVEDGPFEAATTIVMLHQLPNGKFSVFEKVTL